MLIQIDPHLWFSVQEINEDYFDLNSLEINVHGCIIRFATDATIQRMYTSMDVTFLREINEDEIHSPDNILYVRFDVIVYLLIKRLPGFVYKFISLISKYLRTL